MVSRRTVNYHAHAAVLLIITPYILFSCHSWSATGHAREGRWLTSSSSIDCRVLHEAQNKLFRSFLAAGTEGRSAPCCTNTPATVHSTTKQPSEQRRLEGKKRHNTRGLLLSTMPLFEHQHLLLTTSKEGEEKTKQGDGEEPRCPSINKGVGSLCFDRGMMANKSNETSASRHQHHASVPNHI